jgi:hypothetical protein
MLPINVRNQKITVLDIPSLEIARQLTLFEHRLFCNVNSREYLQQSWCRKGKKWKAPNLLVLIARFNQVIHLQPNRS